LPAGAGRKSIHTDYIPGKKYSQCQAKNKADFSGDKIQPFEFKREI
jgi:hypothetical protein